MNEIEIEYIQTLTDQELWIYFNNQHNQLADMRFEGQEIEVQLVALKALEKFEWKRRKNK